MKLQKLFQPIKLGKIELKNRIVMLAVTNGYGENYRVTNRLKNFYAEIGEGGTGFIIVGAFFPSNLGPKAIYKPTTLGLGIYNDEFILELRELTQNIHNAGAKVAAQLSLFYEWRKNEDLDLEVVGPSSVVSGPGIPVPRELSREEIYQIIAEFGEGARRAREAGFDAVEFHAGIGYLINRFLSSRSNRRKDEYGGALENRMRFLLEIIEAARKKAGGDYTYVCRLSADEFVEGGNTIEDTKKMASVLEKEGIAAIDVQAGWHESPVPLIQASVAPGAHVYLAEETKRIVNIPVIAAYRINDPLLAEDIIAKGRADLVGMARALIADPELPNKAKEGRFEEIRPCIACCHCLDDVIESKPMACTVNPRAGKEEEYKIERAKQSMKVFVIGGGPGGMQAATIAAERGHKVSLIERESKLGGQLITATIPPYKQEIDKFKNYLINKVEKSKVNVKLKMEAAIYYVKEEKPDVVIVATGANPIIPEILGINGDNVITAVELLREKKEVGKKVAIVGGGMVGCETADFLADLGKKVTILEMLPRIAADLGPSTRWVMLRRLREKGVRMETRAKVEEITKEGVKVSRDGSVEFFEAGTVVLAVGMRANKEIYDGLRGEAFLTYSIGDCAKPAKIREAIETGFRVAKEI